MNQICTTTSTSKIAKARIKLNYSMEEVGKAIGVNTSVIGKWEHGGVCPYKKSYPAIQNLADLCGMEFNEVLDDIKNKHEYTHFASTYEHLVAPEKVKTNIPDLHTEIVIDKETTKNDEIKCSPSIFNKALKNLYKKTDYSTYVNVVILATGSRLYFETPEDRCRDINKILNDIYEYCDYTSAEYQEIYSYVFENSKIVELG